MRWLRHVGRKLGEWLRLRPAAHPPSNGGKLGKAKGAGLHGAPRKGKHD